MRRLPRTGALLALVGLVLATLAGPALAQTTQTTTPGSANAGFVDVVKVSGLIDPVLADFVEQSIANAESQGARALVLQTNSTGVVISDAAYAALLERMAKATVPVDVWIGPSGSDLTGPSAQMVGRGRPGRHGARHQPRERRCARLAGGGPDEGGPDPGPHRQQRRGRASWGSPRSPRPPSATSS